MMGEIMDIELFAKIVLVVGAGVGVILARFFWRLHVGPRKLNRVLAIVLIVLALVSAVDLIVTVVTP